MALYVLSFMSLCNAIQGDAPAEAEGPPGAGRYSRGYSGAGAEAEAAGPAGSRGMQRVVEAGYRHRPARAAKAPGGVRRQGRIAPAF